MSRPILDTDVISEIQRGKDVTIAARASAYIEAYGRYAISLFTVTEIVKGLHQANRQDQAQAFIDRLQHLEIIGFTVRLRHSQAGSTATCYAPASRSDA